MNYLEMNRAAWDLRAKAHFGSNFYDVAGFLAGNSSLTEIERAELPDVNGRSLLHLQCHFGLDTLSLARMGAICTGVDLSPVAIAQARELARKAKLDATFVCSDLYGYQRQTPEPFDRVFTTYGTICWLPDLDKWATVIADNLAVGGAFYMADFHPVHDLLSGYSYFPRSEPDVETVGTYTENADDAVAQTASWAHPVSAILNALIRAGIQIEWFNEYPFSPYNCFPGLQECEPGRFSLAHDGNAAPLVYSIAGRKP